MIDAHITKVLLVDDDTDLLNTIAESLSMRNIAVTTASCGADALGVLKTQVFDAVLTDIFMPNMSGIEMIAGMRAQNLSTPVILLTGSGAQDLILQALRLGAFDFIDKPFSSVALNAIVDRAVDFGRRLARIDTTRQTLIASTERHPDLERQLEQDVRALSLLKLVNHRKQAG